MARRAGGQRNLDFNHSSPRSAPRTRSAVRRQRGLQHGLPGRRCRRLLPSIGVRAGEARRRHLGRRLHLGAPPPPNQPPSASFSASCSGLTCAFTNTSTDADGTMTHAWSFGDGAASTDASPSHTYAVGGPYTVSLAVTDDDLATDSETHSVTVTAPPPNQPPSASFTPSCNGLSCTFTEHVDRCRRHHDPRLDLRRRHQLHRRQPVVHVRGPPARSPSP